MAGSVTAPAGIISSLCTDLDPRVPRIVIPLSRQLLSLSLCTALVAIAPRAEGQSADKLESRKPFAAWSASAQSVRDSIVAKARGQIGTRYKLGGTKPNLALDCSGLVKYVMGALDVILPRTAQNQATVGQEIPKDFAVMKPGDLLTFGRGKRISHIGIYVGEGRMVHASTSQRRVIETRISERSPLIRQWKGVRRLVDGAGANMRDSLLAFADSLKH